MKYSIKSLIETHDQKICSYTKMKPTKNTLTENSSGKDLPPFWSGINKWVRLQTSFVFGF